MEIPIADVQLNGDARYDVIRDEPPSVLATDCKSPCELNDWF